MPLYRAIPPIVANGALATFVNGANSTTATAGAANLLTLNGGLTAGAAVSVPAASSFYISSRVFLAAVADGIARFVNSGGTDFVRLIFGLNDATGVSIKKSGTAVETKLGDDSAYAALNTLQCGIVDGITAPSATVGLAKLYVDTSDGDLKVIFGDGVIKTIAADT